MKRRQIIKASVSSWRAATCKCKASGFIFLGPSLLVILEALEILGRLCFYFLVQWDWDMPNVAPTGPTQAIMYAFIFTAEYGIWEHQIADTWQACSATYLRILERVPLGCMLWAVTMIPVWLILSLTTPIYSVGFF